MFIKESVKLDHEVLGQKPVFSILNAIFEKSFQLNFQLLEDVFDCFLFVMYDIL